LAGLAIQLYEALTATTTVVSMTMAAGTLVAAGGSLMVAASMLMAAAAVDAIPFFHEGGPIYAHAGWPRLAADEVPIIAQTGERVLSRRQNRDYEAGMAAGGGGGSVVYSPTYHINAIDARGVDAILAKHGKAMTKVISREVGRRGRRL
jgi:hypothetical protein